MVIPKEQIEKNFSSHLPITVTVNEEKLSAIKARTNVTDELTIGTKSAAIDKLKSVGVTF